MKKAAYFLSCLVTLSLLIAATGCSNGSDNNSDEMSGIPPENLLPVVFVHGQSGSAQQFESQAMRFTSNDYPQQLLFAFEYDTSQSTNTLADLDSFIDGVLMQTGESQVYAVGHSRGTSFWTAYLDDPALDGAAKVAKYVNIDGRSPEELPGGVPTIGIWGEWNTANSGFNRSPDNSNSQIGPDPDNNYYFADKSHTETATSAEAFAVMYEYLTQVAPATNDIAEAAPGEDISIAGRAVRFPENLGYAGSTLQIWEVEAATGQRSASNPIATFEIDESGDFGPLQIASGTHYEFALLRPATDTVPMQTVHHFYTEPFVHDNYFVRLQTSFPGESISAFLPSTQDSSGILALRQKEFWGDQGAMSDELFINGLSVLTPQISPRTGVNLAFFAFDEETDNITDLEKGELSPFGGITFLTAADVFIPATAQGTDSIEVVLVTRGGGETRLNVPNWPSATDRNSVMFRDDTR